MARAEVFFVGLCLRRWVEKGSNALGQGDTCPGASHISKALSDGGQGSSVTNSPRHPQAWWASGHVEDVGWDLRGKRGSKGHCQPGDPHQEHRWGVAGGWQEQGTQLLQAILGVQTCLCYGMNRSGTNKQVSPGTSVVK